MSFAYYTTEISKDNNNIYAVHLMENCTEIIEISDSSLRYSTVEQLKIKATIPTDKNQFIRCKNIIIDTMARVKCLLSNPANTSDKQACEEHCFQNRDCIGIVSGRLKSSSKLILEGYQLSGENEITDFIWILNPQELEHLGLAETSRETYNAIDRLINDARHDMKDILSSK